MISVHWLLSLKEQKEAFKGTEPLDKESQRSVPLSYPKLGTRGHCNVPNHFTSLRVRAEPDSVTGEACVTQKLAYSETKL